MGLQGFSADSPAGPAEEPRRAVLRGRDTWWPPHCLPESPPCRTGCWATSGGRRLSGDPPPLPSLRPAAWTPSDLQGCPGDAEPCRCSHVGPARRMSHPPAKWVTPTALPPPSSVDEAPQQHAQESLQLAMDEGPRSSVQTDRLLPHSTFKFSLKVLALQLSIAPSAHPPTHGASARPLMLSPTHAGREAKSKVTGHANPPAARRAPGRRARAFPSRSVTAVQGPQS